MIYNRKTQNIGWARCNFSTVTTVSSSHERSKAIYSVDANYTVDGYCPGVIPIEPCPNLIPSTFVGFNKAIHATSAEQNPAPIIKHSNFDKNMVGIHFQDATHATGLFNEFVIGSHPFPSPFPIEDDANYHTAIIANNSTSYIIEENEVSSDPGTSYLTHGIVVINGGDESLELYKNSFQNLTSASIAIGDNRDIEGAYGLRFICNLNTGNTHDFELRPNGNEYSSIDLYQSGLDGYLHAAGNTFSSGDGPNSNYVNFDFFSDDDYLYRYDETSANQTPLEEEIMVFPGSLTLESGGIPNSCATHFPEGPIDVPHEQQIYLGAKDAYYNLVYTYHQYIDKGNTEGTINDIALLWPEDAWLLRDELMNRSPYNSDSVLIAAADKNILPHGMLLEILIANPDALRGGKVIDHVACCIPNPMPEYMIDILEASKDVRTARTIMEHNRSNLHAEMSRAHRRIMLSYFADTIKTSPDTLIHWYDEMKTRVGRYRLAIEYLDQRNYTAARLALDSLEATLRLSSDQKIELNSLRQYIDFIELIHIEGRTVAQLDSTEVLALKVLSNRLGGGTASNRASNILCFFYDICKTPPSNPKSMGGQLKMPKPKLETLLSERNIVLAKPNPADTYIELEFTLLFEKDNTYINIWDINGRKVHSWKLGMTSMGQKLLDTRKLKSGIYFVELTQDGSRLFSDKFIVQH